MSEFTQQGRPIRIDTRLPEDRLLLAGLSGTEAISTPFSFHLDLLSTDAEISPQTVLGTPALITVELPEGRQRFIHGVIGRFNQAGRQGELVAYEAELVPWTWFLSLTRRHRTFQHRTALEIVEEVLQDWVAAPAWPTPARDFRIQCSQSYPRREFCVQYDESNLDFISRLLEEEGIHYYFEHSRDGHALVLAEESRSAPTCPDLFGARFADGSEEGDDAVTALRREHSVWLGAVRHTSYDDLQPAVLPHAVVHGDGVGFAWSYPGMVTKVDEQTRTDPSHDPYELEARYARIRLEAEEATRDVVRGIGGCWFFQAGHVFALDGHYRPDWNERYLLLEVSHAVTVGDYLTDGGVGYEYRNTFTAIPSGTAYRPPLRTRKPVVRGSQTAMVVGPPGEEIYVDRFGRVKVKFHWDLIDRSEDERSCWIRVSSAWAGRRWGFIQLPRVGQEVIVDFLEGDPDQPIITGRVFNEQSMPPYDLPADKTQSGIKTRSSAQGGANHYNELRFEDRKGEEHIHLHAEKDLSVVVENQERRVVHGERHATIHKDDELIVEEGRTETVTKNYTTVVREGNLTHEVEQGNHQAFVRKGYYGVQVDEGDWREVVRQGKHGTQVEQGDKKVMVERGSIIEEAMQQIHLKVGNSSITIDQTGIKIKGLNVQIEGTTMAALTGNVTQVEGDAILGMKGGITMIN